MNEILRELNSPLFFGIKPEDLKPMLSCIGYHTIDEEKCNGCGLLRQAALRRKKAIENSGKDIPLHIVTISPNGEIIR